MSTEQNNSNLEYSLRKMAENYEELVKMYNERLKEIKEIESRILDNASVIPFNLSSK